MEVMLWIRAPGAQAQGQGSVRPLPWSRGQILRNNRTPLLPPDPNRAQAAQRTALHTALPSSGLAGAQGPASLPGTPPCPHTGPLPSSAAQGLDWGGFAAWPGSPSRRLDSPMATRALQSFLWKSAQDLVLQYLLQVRIP